MIIKIIFTEMDMKENTLLCDLPQNSIVYKLFVVWLGKRAQSPQENTEVCFPLTHHLPVTCDRSFVMPKLQFLYPWNDQLSPSAF